MIVNPTTTIVKSERTGPVATYRRAFCIKQVTGNCQIWAIGNFNSIYNRSDVKAIIYSFWCLCDRKPLLLLDVNIVYEETIKRLFGAENIYSRSEYRSTYIGAKMLLMLIKFPFDKWRTEKLLGT